MKPKPFRPEPLADSDVFIRDAETGLVWHSCSQRVLYADTDRSNVVYHANYLRYFEFGRTTLMREAAYPYKEIEAKGYVYPIVDLGMQFCEPLRYDDLMLVYTRPAEIERVKVRFDYVITHGETENLVCTGHTRHCALSADGSVVAVDEGTVRLWKNFPGKI
jgi:acyl-CoA thioester hydrolase